MSREEDRTIIEEIMDNKRAVQRLENEYNYTDVKIALVVVAVFLIILFIVHFFLTGTLGFK